MIRFFFFSFYLLPLLVFSQYNLEHSVYFDSDLYSMPQTEKTRLFKFVLDLPKKDLIKIEISGFCDDVGAENYNLVLSKKRALAIKDVFSSVSFFPDKIVSVDGRGEVLLNLVPETNPEILRSLNRRVDVVVSYLDKSSPESVSLNKSSGTVVLKNVHFIQGYSYLTRSSKSVLKELSLSLKKTSFSFVIQGHVCCTSGDSDAVDKRTKKRNLSVARAKYVYDYFLEQGIKKERMSYEGLAHRFPLGGSYDKDRRVEIVISSN